MSNSIHAERGKQIALSMQNEAGNLAELTQFLGEQGINIYALTLTGGIDHGYVRMVVDKHSEAMEALAAHGKLVFERDVVLLEVLNSPGSLGQASKVWAEGGVNIEYVYCAGGPNVEQGLVVVRVDDVDKAIALL